MPLLPPSRGSETDDDVLRKGPGRLDELGLGCSRLRGRMCWLSTKVTVGTWFCGGWRDWLMTLDCAGAPLALSAGCCSSGAAVPLVTRAALRWPWSTSLRSRAAASSFFNVDLRRGCLWKVTFSTPM